MFQRFDIETKGWRDRVNGLAIDSLQDGRFAGIVKAPATIFKVLLEPATQSQAA
jgi:hypothetical protein